MPEDDTATRRQDRDLDRERAQAQDRNPDSDPDPEQAYADGKFRGNGRNETRQERADRQWQELVQEIRVAQTGVQILFGFLLTVAFTAHFQQLDEPDRTIYVITVVLGSLATGALIGPVAFHRIVSGRRIKPEAVTWASRLTMVGIVLLLATLVSALSLILRVTTGDDLVPWLVAGVLLWYLLCWFALPLWVRGRHTNGKNDPGNGKRPGQAGGQVKTP
ncbi:MULTISPECIES: DUF6328 family protein [Streptomyces]|uniref:DUF6328 family protein n=1 Tax=Streptomyces TaxID=1883 RepID=UPI001986A6B4|nr:MULTISPECIES: DUF6328 family protein [Streptomyces]GGT04627.1 hypothetical protein GCM10010286_32180 [Streptomyces toxytricini]